MKVLGISGSPRSEGNTEILLQHALAPFREAGWEISEFFLSEQSVLPCNGCESCAGTDQCVIEDDMTLLYETFASCDAIIIGSPVYYRNITAQLKAVFDRSYAVWENRPLKHKAGGAIAVGRGTGGGQCLTLSIIYNFLLSSGALCIPGELNGVSAVADRPGEILKQPKRLQQCRILGNNVLKCAITMKEGKNPSTADNV